MSLLAAKIVCGEGIEGDAVLGQWWTEKKDARIEVFKADNKYAGKIVWVKDPVYPNGDPEAGKPLHDRHNPDVAARDQAILGLKMLRDFEYTGSNSWTRGTIYNPENGKTYKARLSLNKDGSLNVRGYVGVSLLGETTVWTRYEESAAAGKK